MATGFPTKANWVNGDILTAAAQDDLAGTVNLLSNASAASGTVLVSNVAGTSFAYQPLQAAGKNGVINGGMDIWQRGTSSTTISNYATADRWWQYTNAGTCTFAQESTIVPSGFRYSLKATQSVANSTNWQIIQPIETANAIQYAGQTVTASFYAAASASTVLNIAVSYSTSTDVGAGGAWTGIGGTGGSATVTTTGSFTRITGTWTIPSTAKSLLVLIYTTSLTSGTSVYVSGVQLELGSVATTFSRAGGTLQGELANCQRYYYRIAAQNFGSGMAYSTTQGLCWTQFPVTMRTSPTALEQSGTATDYNFLNSVATGVNLSAVATFGAAYPQSAQTSITVAAGLTAGNASKLAANNANAYLGWSAEL